MGGIICGRINTFELRTSSFFLSRLKKVNSEKSCTRAVTALALPDLEDSTNKDASKHAN